MRLIRASYHDTHRSIPDLSSARCRPYRCSLPPSTSLPLFRQGARRELMLPLAGCYCALDAVEGLDVDSPEAEGFEKFGVRGQINTLLLELWRFEDCRDELLQQAEREGWGCESREGEGEGGLLCSLANAMLDTLLYQLEEALKRIREANTAEWADEEGEGGEGYISHLLEGSSSTLRLLDRLTQHSPISCAFSSGRTGRRCASILLKFVSLLCGPRASQLKRRGGRDVGFNPRELLSGLGSLLLHLVGGREGFESCLVDDVDFDLGVLISARRSPTTTTAATTNSHTNTNTNTAVHIAHRTPQTSYHTPHTAHPTPHTSHLTPRTLCVAPHTTMQRTLASSHCTPHSLTFLLRSIQTSD